jgi:hypothetical protein
MKSIFDLIDVVPEKVIKMTETELERILQTNKNRTLF